MPVSQVRSSAHPAGRFPAFDLAFFLLLLIFCAFILSLPLFPNGDGGLHIYYATIFRDLITHRSPLYAQFYAVRHLVQPYLLHYYVFIGLRTVFSADTSEKLLVLAVLLSMALGFRHLARSLSPESPALPLLIFPYLLNWPLSMGALNFDFALGLLFFALGNYERIGTPGDKRRLWRFAGLLLLFVLSHPVPLLLLLCILALDLLLRWRDNGVDFSRLLAGNRPRFLAFGLACVAFVVPVLIADKSQVASTASGIRFHPDYLADIYRGNRLSMFYTPGIVGRLYNRLNTLPFLLSLLLIWRSGFLPRLRQRSLTGSDRLAIFSVLFLAASLFAPFWLNGSGFFSLRLWLPCWLLGIVACAGALRGTRLNWAAAAYGTLLGLGALALGDHLLRPVAVRCAEIEHAPLPVGERGLYVQSIDGEQGSVTVTTYPVFWWNGGRAFIAHDDVMLNSAWLYLTIIPLKENGQAGLLRDSTLRDATEDPNSLGYYFSQHPEQRLPALQSADFLFFVDPRLDHPDVGPVLRLTIEPYMKDWNCDVHDFYAICTKAKGKTRPYRIRSPRD